jgi:hypothetical protein
MSCCVVFFMGISLSLPEDLLIPFLAQVDNFRMADHPLGNSFMLTQIGRLKWMNPVSTLFTGA